MMFFGNSLKTREKLQKSDLWEKYILWLVDSDSPLNSRFCEFKRKPSVNYTAVQAALTCISAAESWMSRIAVHLLQMVAFHLGKSSAEDYWTSQGLDVCCQKVASLPNLAVGLPNSLACCTFLLNIGPFHLTLYSGCHPAMALSFLHKAWSQSGWRPLLRPNISKVLGVKETALHPDSAS